MGANLSTPMLQVQFASREKLQHQQQQQQQQPQAGGGVVVDIIDESTNHSEPETRLRERPSSSSSEASVSTPQEGGEEEMRRVDAVDIDVEAATTSTSSPRTSLAQVHPLLLLRQQKMKQQELLQLFPNDDEDDEVEEEDAYTKVLFAQLSNPSIIGLCGQGLTRILPTLGLLGNRTTKLQLCCNSLTNLPLEIGYLTSLTSLTLNSNKLTRLPHTLSLLTQLRQLEVRSNQLVEVPRELGKLGKVLVHLDVADNLLTHLPAEIAMCSGLEVLDVNRNAITSLPIEFSRLKHLKSLSLESCPLFESFEVPEIQSPPSLKELAARTIIRHSLPVISPLSAHMTDYLASASTCSSCSGPYFTTHYQRIKFIEKPLSPAQIQQQLLDQQQQQHQTVSFHQRIPFEARLCCNHWKSEEERVKDMFAARPVTTPRDLSGDGEVVARIQHQIPASSVEEEKEDAASSTTSIISPPLRRSKSIGDRLFASSSGAVGRIFRKTTSMANLSRRSRSSSGSSSSIDEKVEGIADDEKDSTSPLPSTLSSSSNNNTTTNSSSSDPDTTTTDTALRRGVLARSKSVSFFSRIQVVVHHQQDCHQVSRSHRHLSSSSSRRTGKDISDDEHVASRSSSSSVLISPPFSSSTSSVGILPPAVLVPLSTLLAPSINPPLPTLPKISELDNSNSQQQQQLHNRKSSLNLRMRSVKRTSSLISLRRVIGGGD